MASNDQEKISILELLEELVNCRIDPEENPNKSLCGENEDFISRGAKFNKPIKHQNLHNQLLLKKKRDKMTQGIELLKHFIQEQNEVESLKNLARILNEVTTNEQKSLFIKELHSQNKTTTSEFVTVSTNGGAHQAQRQTCSSSSVLPEEFSSRSGVPQCSNDMLDSLHSQSMGSINSSILTSTPPPISMNRYNCSELYLIQKGIMYCRVLLKTWFNNKDAAILKELKSRKILDLVLNECLDNSRSYLANLADTFPASYEEIIFILREDKEAIFKGQFFVLLARRSIRTLNEFVVKLIKAGHDRLELSQSCDVSSIDGVTVSNILDTNQRSEDAQIKAQLCRFLALHRTTKRTEYSSPNNLPSARY